jgi:hypothetical protein
MLIRSTDTPLKTFKTCKTKREGIAKKMQNQNSHLKLERNMHLRGEKPVKQDFATAALLEKNHPYNIMHQIIQHVHPPDLIQAQLNLRPEAVLFVVNEKHCNSHLIKFMHKTNNIFGPSM